MKYFFCILFLLLGWGSAWSQICNDDTHWICGARDFSVARSKSFVMSEAEALEKYGAPMANNLSQASDLQIIAAAATGIGHPGEPTATYVIEYMMLYDKNGANYAREHYGSLYNHAMRGINTANEVLRESGIDCYFHLCDTMELDVAYKDMMKANEALNLPEVCKKWDENQVDIFGIVCYTPTSQGILGSLSGWSWKQPQWNQSFSVLDAAAAANSRTLIHEAGHVFGCDHDRIAGKGDDAYAVGAIRAPYYTVMAYGHMLPECTEMAPLFSGPEQVWKGVVMGSATEDCTRKMRERLPIVSNFGERKFFFQVDEPHIVLAYDAPWHTFNVWSGTMFNLECDADWLKLEKHSAENDANIYFQTETNFTGQNRTATIRISSIDQDWQPLDVKVTQLGFGGTLLEPSAIKVPSNAQSIELAVTTSNVTYWSIGADGEEASQWISFNRYSATGSATTKMKITENTTSEVRRGTVRCNSSGDWGAQMNSYCTIEQTPADYGFDIDTKELELDSRRHTIMLPMYAGQAFSIESSAPWLVASSSAEVGSLTLSVHVEANDAGDNREGTITLVSADGKSRHIIVVSQRMSSFYQIDTQSWNISNKAQSTTVQLTTRTYFEVEIEDNDWLKATPSKGEGSTAITLTATKNDWGKERYNKVTIKGDESCKPVSMTVVQSASSQINGFEIDVKDLQFDSHDRTETVTMFAGQKFSIESSASWLSAVASAATGTMNLSISVEANNTETLRTGTITLVGTDGVTRHIISVTQQGQPYYKLSMDTCVIDDQAQSVVIELLTNSYFDVQIADDTWMKATPEKGSGNTSITLTFAPNLGEEERSNVLTIKGDSKQVSLFVQQSANEELTAINDAVLSDAEQFWSDNRHVGNGNIHANNGAMQVGNGNSNADNGAMQVGNGIIVTYIGLDGRLFTRKPRNGVYIQRIKYPNGKILTRRMVK